MWSVPPWGTSHLHGGRISLWPCTPVNVYTNAMFTVYQQTKSIRKNDVWQVFGGNHDDDDDDDDEIKFIRLK